MPQLEKKNHRLHFLRAYSSGDTKSNVSLVSPVTRFSLFWRRPLLTFPTYNIIKKHVKFTRLFSVSYKVLLQDFPIKSYNEDINIKLFGRVAILLPEFKEIEDKLKATVDRLVAEIIDQNQNSSNCDNTKKPTERQKIILNEIKDTKFYKEFSKLFKNLEKGKYFVKLFFYSNIGRYNPLDYSTFVINFSSNPKTVSYNEKHLNINFGYMKWITVIHSADKYSDEDLIVLILKIYTTIGEKKKFLMKDGNCGYIDLDSETRILLEKFSDSSLWSDGWPGDGSEPKLTGKRFNIYK